jgi:hypothetical protein
LFYFFRAGKKKGRTAMLDANAKAKALQPVT